MLARLHRHDGSRQGNVTNAARPTISRQTFELERPRLRAVATGILGSRAEAEDAVQEAWFRLDRVDPSTIANLSAWLTVVVSRIALDQIRARTSRREVTIDSPSAAGLAVNESGEASLIFEESVYEALAHALDRLSPLESATFILHDLFRLPFDEISAIIERSPEATRKLASRARQKIAVEDAPTANSRVFTSCDCGSVFACGSQR